MSAGSRRPIAEAERIARAFAAEIESACVHAHCVIAGSIRRRCATVGDIEMVALPRYEAREIPGQAPLFGAPETESVNLVWEAVDAMGADRVRPVTVKDGHRLPDAKWPEKRVEGSKMFRLWLPRARCMVDLFMPASIQTWPVVLAIRTGPADFSRALAMRWTDLTGGHFVRGHLMLPTGDRVEVETERDVFDALGLEWVEPEDRRSRRDVRPIGQARQRRQREELPMPTPEDFALRRHDAYFGDEAAS